MQESSMESTVESLDAVINSIDSLHDKDPTAYG